MRSVSRILLLLPVLAMPGVSWAQTTPSVETLTNALSLPQVPASMLRDRTRGITLTSPAPEASVSAGATSHAARRPAVAAVPETDMCVAGSGSCALTVQFETGSAILSPSALQTLDVIGKALTGPALAGSKFRIEGHTDTVGSRELNLSLSDQRAKAAAAYLKERFGIATERLEPVGVGKDQLLVETGDQISDQRNRKVKVINLSM
jgi:OOP family OmpA-OmpF porin